MNETDRSRKMNGKTHKEEEEDLGIQKKIAFEETEKERSRSSCV